jgi:diguanylate cyclase (GGDEF)-like protein
MSRLEDLLASSGVVLDDDPMASGNGTSTLPATLPAPAPSTPASNPVPAKSRLEALLSAHQADDSTGSGGGDSPRLSALLAQHAAGSSAPPTAGTGNIDLSTPTPGAEVTAGPITPVGVPASEYARLASTGTLKDRIQANLMIQGNPDLANAVAPIARRMQAPGTAATAANLFMGNLVAPLSDRAAQAATEHDLEAYGEGGGDAGAHANLFGAASALGDVAGNVAPVAAERAAAAATRGTAAVAAPEATTVVRRILQSAKSGAKVNAAIGAGGTALFGDENGDHDLGAIAKAAAEQGLVGAAAGAGIGSAVEGAGALGKGVDALTERGRALIDRLTPDEGTPGIQRRIESVIAPKTSKALAAETERRVEAERVASTDDLTGLGNKRAFMSALTNAEPDPNTAVVRFDVNGFKSMNDTHGHPAGDAELAQIGNVLRQAARETGVPERVFRDGGDEFAALVPADQAEAYRDHVETLYGVRDHGSGVRTSISGGVGTTNATADAEAYARKSAQKAAQGIPDSRRVLTGKEFGGPDVATPDLRENARRFAYDNLRGKDFTNADQGVDVAVNRRGIDKTLTHVSDNEGGRAHAQSLVALDQLLEDAQHVSSEPNTDPAQTSLKAVHRFVAPLEIAGRPFRAHLVVKESPDGHFFYDHRLTTIEPGTAEGDIARPVQGRDTPTAEPGSDLSTPRSISSKMGEVQTPETSAEPAPQSSDNVADNAPPPAPNPAASGDDDIEYRHSGPGFVPKALEALKTAYRGAMVTPYAHIEQEAPALVDALHTAGAANAAAQHVSERRAAWVLDGLTKDQRALFGKQLVADNLEAEAKRKGETATEMMATHRKASADELRDGLNGAVDALDRKAAKLPASDKSKYAITADAIELRAAVKAAAKKSDLVDLADDHFAKPLDEISQRFHAHAAEVRADIPDDTELEPWFQTALAKHRSYVEPTMNAASVGAGVDPASFRQPASAYVKLISEDRLTNHEIRRAMDAAQASEPGQLKPRGRITRALIGEKPELRRLFPKGTEGLRQGPINPAAPSSSADLLPPGRRGATRTGSARTAAGSAREYVTDYQRILQQDARDKITRSANNAVYDEVAKVGRPLAAGEEPALGKVAVSREVLDPLSGEPAVQRFEVTRKVANALKKFEHQQLPPDAGVQLWRKTTNTLTRAQISGMPVEATSHMNTLASIVASVPGEKDVAGKVIAAVPGAGAKAAAIREMTGINFKNPKIRALESRLADIGALRIDEDRGGLVNTAHHALFGPEGVDVRGRLVLARKYLDRKPNATDGELREFVTSKLGNYIRANSGAAVNALQDVGVSAFARFQGARIPASIRSTFGASGLPGTPVQRAIDAASTLYRGPVGYAIGSDLANRAITGHGTLDNEPGHHGDVATGLYATPDGLKHMTEEEAAAYGSHARPLYIPMATLNPVLATGMRASGARGVALGNGNKGTRIADALRDVENTGLGVAGPAIRALSAAASGRTPYLLSDGSFLPVSEPEFDKGHEMHSRVVAAVEGANPALAATEFGGGAGGRNLYDALETDGKFMGGPQSIAARIASFVLPRIATVGVGGADNEGSEVAQAERDYRDVMARYKADLRRAPGSESEDEIIDAAVADAKSDGRFDPKVVRAELEKYISVPEEKRDRAREHSAGRFTNKKLTGGEP